MTDDGAREYADAPEPEAPRRGFWGRLRSGLGKTRSQLAEGVGNLLLGEREIDEGVLEELETALLMTDVGVDTTQEVMADLALRVRRRELNDTRALHDALAGLLKERLRPLARPLTVPPADARQGPYVIFFVGVNGVGKTTTIGKLASRFLADGHSVVLAAGDTFRAAAVEQLKTWGERIGVPVIAQAQGADSASVVFDAVAAARSRQVDLVLADTAGRLQAKTNLMEELRKIRRVVAKADPEAPQQVLLVLDAGVGQNAISQLREFNEAVPLTGLVITKLDGSARAGVLFALAKAMQSMAGLPDGVLPVYFIGVGESVDDLSPFDPDAFVDALLARD